MRSTLCRMDQLSALRDSKREREREPQNALHGSNNMPRPWLPWESWQQVDRSRPTF